MYLLQIVNSQYKTNSIQNIRFTRPIQASNSIELGVPSGDYRPSGIWFEALQNDFFNVHLIAGLARFNSNRGSG